MLITPVVGKREANPIVQFRSLFVNTFSSSSEAYNKSKDKVEKPEVFGLHVCPFFVDLLCSPPTGK